MDIQRITVVGAGTMGNGIAHVSAQSGKDVWLVDVNREFLDRAIATITKNLDRQVKKELLDEEGKTATLDRIKIGTSIEEAAEESQLVVEAAPEDLSLKHEIFRTLDEVAPSDAILASNTSSISITQIGSFTERPEKVIGMHFMNPVPMMKLIEVIRGLATDDTTTSTVMDLSQELGKTPVEVNDFPGFVANRILMPMINEAFFALMEGLADLIGLDVCLSILEVLHRDLGDDRYRPCPVLRKYVAAGWLGRKTGRGVYSYE